LKKWNVSIQQISLKFSSVEKICMNRVVKGVYNIRRNMRKANRQ